MTRAWKAAAAVLLLAVPALVMADETPDATLDFTAKAVAVGVGVTWGQGTLHYGGKDYTFTVSGLGVVNVGANDIAATGEVYHLANLADFDGSYAAVSAGITFAGGEASSAMENQKGVVIHMHSTTKGLQLNASVEGVTMKLAGN